MGLCGWLWALVGGLGLLLRQGSAYAFCDLFFDEISIGSSLLCGRIADAKLFVVPLHGVSESLNFRLFLRRFIRILLDIFKPLSTVFVFFDFPGFWINLIVCH